jgi:hypothetical protein
MDGIGRYIHIHYRIDIIWNFSKNELIGMVAGNKIFQTEPRHQNGDFRQRCQASGISAVYGTFTSEYHTPQQPTSARRRIENLR